MLYLRARRDNEAFYAKLAEGRIKRLAGPPYEGAVYTGEEYDPAEVKLLPPSEPTKIVAVGLNYAKQRCRAEGEAGQQPGAVYKAPDVADYLRGGDCLASGVTAGGLRG